MNHLAQLSFSLKLKASQGKKFKVVLRIATKHTASVILLQDTHTTSNDNHHDQWWYFYHQYLSPFPPPPLYQHPAIYSGDFNCHHTPWGYSSNNPDREALHDGTHTVDLKLLCDHKQAKSFHLAVWNTQTNPDLTFYSCDVNSLSPHPVGGNFPKSQHRPTIIYHPALVEYTPTNRIPRWNFNKADWGRFKTESTTMYDHLSVPDTDINICYSVLQRKSLDIAKWTISRCFRNPYIPGRNPTYEVLENDLEKAQSIPDKQELHINC